jgi:hypothetical protein
MYPQIAASGSSPNTASSVASTISPPVWVVTTSNHASQTSIVPVTAAKTARERERVTAAHAVAAKAAASAMSNPTHARSYRSVTCLEGSENVSQSVHGTRRSATSASSGATQRGR